jgi:hypothetical protein
MIYFFDLTKIVQIVSNCFVVLKIFNFHVSVNVSSATKYFFDTDLPVYKFPSIKHFLGSRLKHCTVAIAKRSHEKFVDLGLVLVSATPRT